MKGLKFFASVFGCSIVRLVMTSFERWSRSDKKCFKFFIAQFRLIVAKHGATAIIAIVSIVNSLPTKR